jgi:NADH dehydrogenase
MTVDKATGQPRVVIVGAGFAGLAAAKVLAKTPARVTLVDQHNYHLFQPLLYQLATGMLEPADIAHPIRGIFHGRSGVHVQMGEVTGVDFEARRVLIEGDEPLEYDYLILSAGASVATFGIPGVEEYSFPLKSLAHSVRLRSHLLRQFELAEIDPSLVDEGALTVVVVGGGPTGVEMAGSTVELFHHVLKHDFPELEVGRSRVILLEATDHLLPPFHPESRRHAVETLEKRGVEVLTGQAMDRVTPDEVTLKDGTVIKTRTLVWAAGVRVCPLADALGVEQTRGGRVVVNDDLSVPGHPEVYVVGDMAAATDDKGGLYPQVAQVALQSAKYAAKRVKDQLSGRTPDPKRFTYKDKGIMATIGRHAAVTELPRGPRFKGVLAWFMWLALHLVYIVGFRSRLAALLNWGWNHITYDRHARLIFDPVQASQPAGEPAREPARELPAAAPVVRAKTDPVPTPQERRRPG